MDNPRTIIIEAERLNSEYYKKILADVQINKVFELNNSHKIFPALKKINPDIIILDIAICDEIISCKIIDELILKKTNVPVIVISSIFNIEIMKKLKLIPNSKFMLKPVNVLDLSNFMHGLNPTQKINFS